MKAFTTVMKILAVLAAVGAAVYVGITYGDKIIAWVKKVLKLEQDAQVICYEGECAEDCCEGECAEGCCCDAEEDAVADDTDFEGQ